MTNKEIIIDGVDVSNCVNFNKWTDHTCKLEGKGNTRTLCKSLDCYYKQLKKVEQKLEKIKDYCLKNKVAGWIDIEGIIEIIEGK